MYKIHVVDEIPMIHVQGDSVGTLFLLGVVRCVIYGRCHLVEEIVCILVENGALNAETLTSFYFCACGARIGWREGCVHMLRRLWAGDLWHSNKIIRADEKNTGIMEMTIFGQFDSRIKVKGPELV